MIQQILNIILNTKMITQFVYLDIIKPRITYSAYIIDCNSICKNGKGIFYLESSSESMS